MQNSVHIEATERSPMDGGARDCVSPQSSVAYVNLPKVSVTSEGYGSAIT
jgi:hypothetical protein